jgi:hypothetical protein
VKFPQRERSGENRLFLALAVWSAPAMKARRRTSAMRFGGTDIARSKTDDLLCNEAGH